MQVDPDVVEFEGSNIMHAVYIGMSLLIAYGFVRGLQTADDILDAAITGLVVVGMFAGAILLIDQYRPRRGPVVTFSPEGIRDVRVAPEIIAWRAVQMIQPQRSFGNRSLVLTVDAGTIERAGGTRRGPVRPSGPVSAPQVIQISGSGLKVRFRTLCDTCREFAHRYGHAKIE